MASLMDHSQMDDIPNPASSATSPNAALSSAPASPPIPTFSLRSAIGGRDTELLVQTFDDRVFVVVTQNGKVGCLVSYVPVRRVWPGAVGRNSRIIKPACIAPPRRSCRVGIAVDVG
jgi:hypothetical protein